MNDDVAATFPRPFVPLAELPGAADRELDPAWDDPEFIAKQVAVLDARRRQGMNLIVSRDGNRIVQIAPDGAETDVTDEANRRVAQARKHLGWTD